MVILMKAKVLRKKKESSLTPELMQKYRAKPVVACLDLLGIALNSYQQIMLEESWNARYPLWKLNRGGGKTFMGAVFLILKALLYPKTKIGIISSSYRQANFVFDAIDEIYFDSPFLQRETIKASGRSNNQTILRFKNGSFIEALPIGDGKKIRGRRYHVIFLDEYAQIPEKIINLVIRPMMIVRKGYDPRNIGKNIKYEANQTLIASTAYYKYNHFWKVEQMYRKSISDGSKDHVVLTFDADDAMAEELLDEEELNNQRMTMDEDEFMMEYYCISPDDSSGWIRKSAIDAISTLEEPELNADPDGVYVFGVDCARSPGGDNFALLILKLMGRELHLSRIETLNGVPFQDMAEFIRKRVIMYNPVEVYMDSGGGGLALKDLLAVDGLDPETGEICLPIFDKNDETVDPDASGYHVLTMVNFRETALIHNMGVEVKKVFQQKRLKMPANLIRYGAMGNEFFASDEERLLADASREVMLLKKECMLIKAIPSGNWFKFEMPTAAESGESRKNLRKDRWTALNLAVWAAKQWTTGGDISGGCIGFWG